MTTSTLDTLSPFRLKQRAVALSFETKPAWTFLTNHAHVLLCIVQEPEIKMRNVAHKVGITERAVQRIIADLVESGYLVRSRRGRCNYYEVKQDLPLRHPLESHEQVASLIQAMIGVHGIPSQS